jgi:hypothetical protein
MRTKLNSKQRLRLKQKREHNEEIREVFDNGEIIPACQICYTKLTSKNKIDLTFFFLLKFTCLLCCMLNYFLIILYREGGWNELLDRDAQDSFRKCGFYHMIVKELKVKFNDSDYN